MQFLRKSVVGGEFLFPLGRRLCGWANAPECPQGTKGEFDLLVCRHLLVDTNQAALGMNIEASGSANVRIGSK